MQLLASANVSEADEKEEYGQGDENQVQHFSLQR
jgi:hypothetical protein